jgi:hypothetical protein
MGRSALGRFSGEIDEFLAIVTPHHLRMLKPHLAGLANDERRAAIVGLDYQNIDSGIAHLQQQWSKISGENSRLGRSWRLPTSGRHATPPLRHIGEALDRYYREHLQSMNLEVPC